MPIIHNPPGWFGPPPPIAEEFWKYKRQLTRVSRDIERRKLELEGTGKDPDNDINLLAMYRIWGELDMEFEEFRRKHGV